MLKWWFSVFIIISTWKISFSQEKTGTPGNSIDDKFPTIYRMENYYSCPPKYAFCTITMKLIPQDYKSNIWKDLESWSVSDFHYNRTIVHRTFCIPPCFNHESQIKHFAESKANKELEAYNLTTLKLSHDCLNRQSSINDFASNLLMIPLHLGLVAVATLYELYGGNNEKLNIVQKLVLCFSLMNYIKSFSKSLKTENLGNPQKIKCMEGARLISTISVIGLHAFLIFMAKYLKNPHELEQVVDTPIIKGLIKFSLVTVQTFFVLSSWLLTRQILNLHSSEGEFSIRHCILTVIHRIAKIWPLLAYVIFIGLPLLTHLETGPGNYHITNHLRGPCSSSRKFWTFLHVNNFFKNFDICHIGFWTLSLDMQYYLINTIFLYVILKYKMDIKKGLTILFVATYSIYAFQIYSNNITLSEWINLKLFVSFSGLNNPKLSYIYFGFFVNFTSSLIGILFGYIEFQTRNMKRPMAYRKIYGLVAISLVFSFLLQSGNYSVLATSLLIPIFKITFSLGIGMTIYGVSRDIIRGPLKFMLEHKYVQTLANYCYAVYLFHFVWVFGRGGQNSSPLEFTLLRVLWIFLQDCVISFAIGLFATATVFDPSQRLKNLILPPIRKNLHGKEQQIESKKM